MGQMVTQHPVCGVLARSNKMFQGIILSHFAGLVLVHELMLDLL